MAGDYELVLITPGGGESSNHKKAVDEIKKLITSEKGEVLEVEDWGKKELAYPIKKETAGFYTLINFRGDTSIPNTLNSKMRLMEDLLRYLVVKKEVKDPKIKIKKRVTKPN